MTKGKAEGKGHKGQGTRGRKPVVDSGEWLVKYREQFVSTLSRLLEEERQIPGVHDVRPRADKKKKGVMGKKAGSG